MAGLHDWGRGGGSLGVEDRRRSHFLPGQCSLGAGRLAPGRGRARDAGARRAEPWSAAAGSDGVLLLAIAGVQRNYHAWHRWGRGSWGAPLGWASCIQNESRSVAGECLEGVDGRYFRHMATVGVAGCRRLEVEAHGPDGRVTRGIRIAAAAAAAGRASRQSHRRSPVVVASCSLSQYLPFPFMPTMLDGAPAAYHQRALESRGRGRCQSPNPSPEIPRAASSHLQGTAPTLLKASTGRGWSDCPRWRERFAGEQKCDADSDAQADGGRGDRGGSGLGAHGGCSNQRSEGGGRGADPRERSSGEDVEGGLCAQCPRCLAARKQTAFWKEGVGVLGKAGPSHVVPAS